MSGVKACWLQCDQCGEASNLNGGGCSTIADARAEAKLFGWVRRNGRDLCEACKDE